MALQRTDNALIVVDDVVGRLRRRHGAELVGEIAQFQGSYRLCFVRGPEGILVGVAQ